MTKKVFSVRDGKGQFYGPIFLKDQEGEAIRDLESAVNSGNAGLLSQFPEDFDLFLIGEYDNHAGKLIPMESPKHLIKALHLKRAASETGPIVQQ